MEGTLRNMTSIYITRTEAGQKQMLLLYRIGSRVVAPSWCGIGGHFEPEELNDAQAAALRELKEEIHLTADKLRNLKLRYVTLRLKGGEIRQNYYFFAELKKGAQVELHSSEGIPQWVPYEEILKREMPYTARYVVEHYLKYGSRSWILYAGVAGTEGVSFLPLEEF